MGLSAALNNAMSGLRFTQAGMEVVSTNVANSGSVGYNRRTLGGIENVVGGTSSGVLAGNQQRVLDTLIQRQYRTELSGAAYTSVRAEFYSTIDQLYGQPGGANALDTQLNNFSTSLDSLQANPASASARNDVLDKGSILANRLGELSRSVQDLRGGAEGAIANGVARANDLLSQLERSNSQITGYPAGQAPPSLLDQRDSVINELSQLLDVRVTENADGGVSLATGGGVLLFDGQRATRLEFQETPNIGPQTVYSTDPATSGLGTIKALTGSGGSIDLLATNGLRSGELAAYVELRDKTLVQAQEQLDQLAAGLSRALSDEQRGSSAVTVAGADGFGIDTTGFQTGTILTIETATTAGQTRKVTVNADLSGGLAGLTTQVQDALGAGFSVSVAGGVLQIVDDGAANTTNVVGVKASVTQTALTGPNATTFPFFTDGSGPSSIYTGAGTQLTGFSQRIAVNPSLKADPSALVVYDAGVLSGDPTRPTALVNALSNATFNFTTSAPLSGFTQQFSGTVGSFARRIVESQGAASASAASLNEGQQVALSTIEGRFAEYSGVNVDQELSQLIQLQTAYSANARVITAVKEMMDLLLRI